MSDDLGTVGAKKGDRAREMARLREHYRNHRDALTGLMGDSPSDHLANEYQRLITEIDMTVRKIDELEGKPASSGPVLDTNPMIRPKATRPGMTAPGNRPLVRPEETSGAGAANPSSRLVMILGLAAIVLLGIAGLIWYASSGKRPAPNATSTAPVVEQPATTTNAAASTISPATPPGAIKITPALADYGTIRKGTRAVRQFEVRNNSGSPVEMQVARSQCRCLFYDYKSRLAGGAKETITVTIDGARAKEGELREDVTVTAKNDPAVSSTFTVQATIR